MTGAMLGAPADPERRSLPKMEEIARNSGSPAKVEAIRVALMGINPLGTL